MNMNMNANRRSGGTCRGNTRYTPMGRSEINGQAPWLRLDNSGQQGQVGGSGSGNGNGCGCSIGCNNGCGCAQNTDTTSCKHLLEQLRKLDFSLYEVVLYLDAYPNCCEALALYHQLVAKRQEVLSLYEAACGPLTVGGNQSHTSWDWFKGPFPWEYEAN